MVIRGDTLWDMANHYLGDPFGYHEPTEFSHFKDPLWIYPTDVIRIIRKKNSKSEIPNPKSKRFDY